MVAVEMSGIDDVHKKRVNQCFPLHNIRFHFLWPSLVMVCKRWLFQAESRTDHLPRVYGETAESSQVLHRDKPGQSRDVASGKICLYGYSRSCNLLSIVILKRNKSWFWGNTPKRDQ